MNKPEQVGAYFDKWTDLYLKTYGDTIQSCRPNQLAELHELTMRSVNMQPHHRVLDAGCGVCGPGAYFAKKLGVKIDAITISPKQVEIGKERIKGEGLEDKVNIICDDFFNVDKLFAPETFDIVLFLEALGHSDRPNEVVKKMWDVLKPGGVIYIKDFFINESEKIPRQRTDHVIDTINSAYCYNTQQLPSLISALRKAGFILEWVKNPDYEKDWQVVFDFEKQAGFDSWGGMEKFGHLEMFEMRFHKPHRV